LKRGFGPAILAAGLLISGCSLAGDVTPPPALATAQMAAPAEPPTPAPLIPPVTQPDIAAGAASSPQKVTEQSNPPQAELQFGTVAGRVTNGSAGGTLPAGLEVSLFGYDGDQEAVKETTTLGSDGSFAFEDLEYVPGRLFIATVVHDGMTYRSDVAYPASDGSAVDLPIMIYETSQDRSALRVERLHLIFDFPAEDTLRVLELWVLANDSDRVLTTPLQIALPEGASNLTFEEGSIGGRFEITNDGFVDLKPIPPGSGLDHLVFGFEMPVSRSTQFDQLMRHPVDAVTVLIPPGGPNVTGLQDRGIQDIGGLRLQSYTEGSLAAEELLSFRVSAPSSGSSVSTTVIVGAGALVVAGLLAARLWVGARPGKLDGENLLQEIARLDDEYEAGELSEEEWRRQREPLKRQALDQMRRAEN